MRNELTSVVASGKTHDEVIQYYVEKYGSQEPLASPIDKGFNRLAWLVPYLAGATGILVVGAAAIKWSRRHEPSSAESSEAAIDPELNERLNDELSNID